MPSNRNVSHRTPRRRRRGFFALALILLPLLAGFLYYRIDEAPTALAQSMAAPPARNVADADNAWLYLTGLGAAGNVEPIAAGRTLADAFLAGASREAIDAEATPEMKPDLKRDGFNVVCRPSLGGCMAWAAQHRDALLRLVEANQLRLTRLDRADAVKHWQEPPLINGYFPPFPATTIRLQFAALALRASSGEDPVAVGRDIASHAALWRRASEQADWLISKAFAVAFLADAQRLIVEIYARATPDRRQALDAAVDATLAAPGTAASSLDLYAYDASRMSAVSARALFPGLAAALRQCLHGEPDEPAAPPSVEMVPTACSERLVDNLTFRPQATANRAAEFLDAKRTMLAAAPANEAEAVARYEERTTTLRNALQPTPRLLPRYNESGNRFVVLSDEPNPIGSYRHRLNDYELLRRMLVIRVAALRADIAEAGMDAFLGTQPAALRHPYPDKAIRWDGVRGAFIAPTAIEGMFDEDGIVMSYREGNG